MKPTDEAIREAMAGCFESPPPTVFLSTHPPDIAHQPLVSQINKWLHDRHRLATTFSVVEALDDMGKLVKDDDPSCYRETDMPKQREIQVASERITIRQLTADEQKERDQMWEREKQKAAELRAEVAETRKHYLGH